MDTDKAFCIVHIYLFSNHNWLHSCECTNIKLFIRELVDSLCSDSTNTPYIYGHCQRMTRWAPSAHQLLSSLSLYVHMLHLVSVFQSLHSFNILMKCFTGFFIVYSLTLLCALAPPFCCLWLCKTITGIEYVSLSVVLRYLALPFTAISCSQSPSNIFVLTHTVSDGLYM